MLKIAIVLSVLALALPLASSSYADTIDIRIHTGSSDPNQHLTFYPPSSTGHVGDVIQIGNGDTVTHEVVSGTPNSGADGTFDSGVINQGQYFTYTITSSDIGTISFFDKTYPWMTGSVTVQETNATDKIIHNVGADVGDGATTFDVHYTSVKDIISASVKAKDKSVNFVLVGKADSNSTLVLKLPKGLIASPFIGVWVDNQPITGYTVTDEATVSTVTIPITPISEQISIVGTSVVPEFGPVAMIVLAIALFAIVAFTRFRPIHKLE